MHFSKWRFFDQLHFLADSLTPRHAASNLDIETVDGDENHGNTVASSVHLPVKRRGQPSADEVLPIMRQTLAKMGSPPQVINTPCQKQNWRRDIYWTNVYHAWRYIRILWKGKLKNDYQEWN